MDRTKQIVVRLKPKVKAFGFNKKELMGVAAKIADNLTLDDDASDEDANAAIDEAIDAVVPYLEAGRSYANRVINDSRKNGDEENNDDEDGENPSSQQSNKPGKGAGTNDKDEEPAWFAKFREQQEARFAAIEGQRTTETRKSRLETILKNAGLTDKTFGKLTLKNFAKMKFDNDEEFDEFISDVEDDVKAYTQERADEGLSTTPPGAGNGNTNKPKELTDAEVDEIIATIP